MRAAVWREEPPAMAPMAPIPRPLIRACMVRLRGNPPAEPAGAGSPSPPPVSGGRSRSRLISIRLSASRARIASRCDGVGRRIIFVVREYSLQNHAVFLPFAAHGVEERRLSGRDFGR